MPFEPGSRRGRRTPAKGHNRRAMQLGMAGAHVVKALIDAVWKPAHGARASVPRGSAVAPRKRPKWKAVSRTAVSSATDSVVNAVAAVTEARCRSECAKAAITQLAPGPTRRSPAGPARFAPRFAYARIGQLLETKERIPVGRSATVEHVDRRIARVDHPVGSPQRTRLTRVRAPGRARSRYARTVARSTTLPPRACSSAVRPRKRGCSCASTVGLLWFGKELQRLVDPEHVADALQRIGAERPAFTALVVVEGGAARRAEQHPRLPVIHAPASMMRKNARLAAR